ncbi:MAG: hypothetical protein HFF97_05890 [Oscillibacter sp.]|nr:hypothetical protein [Oscillibacter sp.]
MRYKNAIPASRLPAAILAPAAALALVCVGAGPPALPRGRRAAPLLSGQGGLHAALRSENIPGGQAPPGML